MFTKRTIAGAAIAMFAFGACGSSNVKKLTQAAPTTTAAPATSATSAPTVVVTTPPTTAEPASESPKVVGSGFTQLTADSIGNSYLTYAVVIENPNKSSAVERLPVNVTFKDGGGQVVKSQSDTISLILPGSRAAVGDSTGVTGAKSMEVQLGAPTFEQLSSPGAFAVDGVKTTADSYSMSTKGTLHSTFAKELKDVKATAVYYDAAGKVIGGASTYVDFVPAGGTIGVEVRGTEVVPKTAKTDVLVGLSGLSLLQGG